MHKSKQIFMHDSKFLHASSKFTNLSTDIKTER